MREFVIYDNYDLDEMYDDAKIFLMEEYPELCEVEVEDYKTGEIYMEPSDSQIWDEIYSEDEFIWADTWTELKHFFEGKQLIMFGSVGRWTGPCSGAEIGSFEELFYDIIKDCAYIKIVDQAGHFLLKCSHHDGTNYVEFKELSDKGYELYNNWEYSYGNSKTVNYSDQQLYELIAHNNFYSKLPHYKKLVWG